MSEQTNSMPAQASYHSSQGPDAERAGPRLEIVRTTGEVLTADVEHIRVERVADACDGNADRIRSALFSFLFEPECWRRPSAMRAFRGRRWLICGQRQAFL